MLHFKGHTRQLPRVGCHVRQQCGTAEGLSDSELAMVAALGVGSSLRIGQGSSAKWTIQSFLIDDTDQLRRLCTGFTHQAAGGRVLQGVCPEDGRIEDGCVFRVGVRFTSDYCDVVGCKRGGGGWESGRTSSLGPGHAPRLYGQRFAPKVFSSTAASGSLLSRPVCDSEPGGRAYHFTALRLLDARQVNLDAHCAT